jgi:Zn-dependent protease
MGFNLTPAELISRFLVLVIAFTVHEFAHAFVADRFGDTTPRSQGRLTLNPLAHLDPLGSLLLLLTGFGWAKPVMINPYALERRNPAAPMLVALAGPASNFLLAVIGALPVRLGLVSAGFASTGLFPTLPQFIDDFIVINLLLMLFNLIPLAPLDGEKVLTYFLPRSGQQFMDQIRPYGPLLLMATIFLLPRMGINLLGILIGRPMQFLYQFLLG